MSFKNYKYIVSHSYFAVLMDDELTWKVVVPELPNATLNKHNLRMGSWRYAGDSLLDLIEWSKGRERKELCLAI